MHVGFCEIQVREDAPYWSEFRLTPPNSWLTLAGYGEPPNWKGPRLIEPARRVLSDEEARQVGFVASHFLLEPFGVAVIDMTQRLWWESLIRYHGALCRLPAEEMSRTVHTALVSLEADAQMHARFPVSRGWSETEEHFVYLFHDGRPVERAAELILIHAIRYGCQTFLETKLQSNLIDALAAKVRMAGEVVTKDVGNAYRDLLRRAERATSRYFPPGNYDPKSLKEEKEGWLSEILAEQIDRFKHADISEIIASVFSGDVVGEGAANAHTVLRRKVTDRLRMATAERRFPTEEAAQHLRDELAEKTASRPLRIKFAPTWLERLREEYGEYAPGYLELRPDTDLTEREIAQILGCTPRTLRNIRLRSKAKPALFEECFPGATPPKDK